jgi:hypothetical protein
MSRAHTNAPSSLGSSFDRCARSLCCSSSALVASCALVDARTQTSITAFSASIPCCDPTSYTLLILLLLLPQPPRQPKKRPLAQYTHTHTHTRRARRRKREEDAPPPCVQKCTLAATRAPTRLRPLDRVPGAAPLGGVQCGRMPDGAARMMRARNKRRVARAVRLTQTQTEVSYIIESSSR